MRNSFWFLPSIMAIAAGALAFGAVTLDRSIGGELPGGLSWIYTGGPEGASAVLGAIAGSMITIAGVVLSMTLVALSLASQQFGPRLLRNFMRDASNQFVIGTFIATFLYCLLVLRTIRYVDASSFVPQIAVTIGVGFALLSLAVLIYFIHHVAVSIQADAIIARVSEELDEGIERLFPEHLGVDSEGRGLTTDVPSDFDANSTPICAAHGGYLQFVDPEQLMTVAVRERLIVIIERRPGHFSVEGSVLARAHPAACVSEETRKHLQEAFVLGEQRTPAQDLEFSLGQLVEIAVRALSPGVNDPFTAITCVDHLGAALCKLARREMPTARRRDEDGTLRVIAPTTGFPALLAHALNQIRQASESSVAVSIRLLETLDGIAEFVVRDADKDALVRQADIVLAMAQRQSFHATDLEDIEARYRRVATRLVR